MPEPQGSAMPQNYDDASTLLGDLVDHRNLVLDTGVNETATEIIVTGNVSDIPIPVYVAFNDGEIIYCDTRRGNNDGWTGVVRGARGTTATSHEAEDDMWCVLTGKHVSLSRDALLAAEKYQGLYDIIANIPTPNNFAVGEVYVASDEDKAYFALGIIDPPSVDIFWKWVGRTAHDELDNLQVDDHTQYHNDARALTWHDGLAGGHVQDGDNHTHIKGIGIARTAGGLIGARPAPTHERQVYYATDESVLYISPDGIAWAPLTGATTGVIAWYTETSITGHGGACPSGWSRYTALDDRFPIGAPDGVVEGLGNLGANTHSHTYTEFPVHLHVVPAQSPASTYVGHHHHNFPRKLGSSVGANYIANADYTWEHTAGAGTHSHTATVPARVTQGAKRTSDDAVGVAEGTTSTDGHLPPWHTVVFCVKD